MRLDRLYKITENEHIKYMIGI